MDLAAAATTWPRVNQVTSRNDSVAMLLMVVLAQEDRARIGDHFHLCLRDAAPVTRNPEVLAHAGFVVPQRLGGAKDFHRQSLQRLMSGPVPQYDGPGAVMLRVYGLLPARRPGCG